MTIKWTSIAKTMMVAEATEPSGGFSTFKPDKKQKLNGVKSHELRQFIHNIITSFTGR